MKLDSILRIVAIALAAGGTVVGGVATHQQIKRGNEERIRRDQQAREAEQNKQIEEKKES